MAALACVLLAERVVELACVGTTGTEAGYQWLGTLMTSLASGVHTGFAEFLDLRFDDCFGGPRKEFDLLRRTRPCVTRLRPRRTTRGEGILANVQRAFFPALVLAFFPAFVVAV